MMASIFSPVIERVYAAEAEANNAGVGIHIGTTGVTVDLALPLSQRLNIRGGYNFFEFDEEIDSSNVEYDTRFEMNSFSLLADWHVFGNSFRLSGGAFKYFENSLSGTGVASTAQTFTINDRVYSANDVGSLAAKIEFDDVAPYFGIGWGNAVGDGGLSFSFDLGVINIGNPDVSVIPNCLADPALCAQIDADIAAEVAELEREVDDYEWWPVVKFGLVFKF